MHKIEKLTATKLQHADKIMLGLQLKIDNGLSVQSNFPILGSDPERDAAKSISIINDIVAQIFEGLNPLRQKELDKMITELSAIHDQSALRTNIAMGVSLTIFKAAAALHNQSVQAYIRHVYGYTSPTKIATVPVFTCIKNKGQNGEFKEFLLIPNRNKSVPDAFTLFRTLGSSVTTGEIMNTVQLEILEKNAENAGYALHHDVFFGIKPELSFDSQKGYSCNDMLQTVEQNQLIDYYKEIQALYAPLITENPCHQHDIMSLVKLHKEIGEQTILTISSDYFPSQVDLKKYAGALPNAMLSLQYRNISSVTNCLDLIDLAKKSDWKIMIDTNDFTDTNLLLAFAFGTDADFVKIDSCDATVEKEFLYDRESN